MRNKSDSYLKTGDVKHPNSGIAIRNLNPAAAQTRSMSRNSDDVLQLNTQEQREVESMVQYLDEKLAVNNFNECPELFQDVYSEAQLIKPVSMNHADSLYKESKERQKQSREEIATTLLDEIGPAEISVQYHGKPPNTNAGQSVQQHPYLLPKMAKSKQEIRQQTSSKITLGSSIDSSTQELLQLIQNHPRDSSLSTYSLLDNNLSKAAAPQVRYRAANFSSGEQVMHVDLKPRKISASGMLPQLENGQIVHKQNVNPHINETKQPAAKSRVQARNYVSNRASYRNTQVLMTKLSQRNNANMTIDEAKAVRNDPPHEPYLHTVSVQDLHKSQMNQRYSSSEGISVAQLPRASQRLTQQKLSGRNKIAKVSSLSKERPQVHIQLRQGIENSHQKTLLNKDLRASNQNGLNSDEQREARRNHALGLQTQMRMATNQQNSSVASSQSGWPKQPRTEGISRKATLALQSLKYKHESSEHANHSEATLTQEEEEGMLHLTGERQELLMMELSPPKMRYNGSNNLRKERGEDAQVSQHLITFEQLQPRTSGLRPVVFSEKPSPPKILQTNVKQAESAATRNSIFNFEFQRESALREQLLGKQQKKKPFVGRLRYQSLQNSRSHFTVDSSSQQQLLRIQQSLENRPLAGIFQKLTDEQVAFAEQHQKALKASKSASRLKHVESITVTPTRFPPVSPNKNQSSCFKLRTSKNTTLKDGGSIGLNSSIQQPQFDSHSPLAPLYKDSAQSIMKQDTKDTTPFQKSASCLEAASIYDLIDHKKLPAFAAKQQISQLNRSLEEMADISHFLDQQHLDYSSNEEQRSAQGSQNAIMRSSLGAEGQVSMNNNKFVETEVIQGIQDSTPDVLTVDQEQMQSSLENSAYVLEQRLSDINNQIRLEENQRSSFDMSIGQNTQNAAYFQTVKSSENQPNVGEHHQQKQAIENEELSQKQPLPPQKALDVRKFETVGFKMAGSHLKADTNAQLRPEFQHTLGFSLETKKQLYATMQDQSKTKGEGDVERIQNVNTFMEHLRQKQNTSANSFQQQPLSRLSEKSGQPTLGVNQARPDYVNSDLSDLDKKLIPTAKDKQPQSRVLKQSQPRLGAMDKGQIKIQVKHLDAAGKKKTVIHQHSSPKRQKNNSRSKNKSNQKSAVVDKKAIEEVKLKKLKKSAEKAYAAVETQTPVINDMMDETLVFGSTAHDPIDQLILVQTDNQGMVTFQNLASSQNINYSKIEQEPTINMDPGNNYETNAMQLTSSLTSNFTQEPIHLIKSQYAHGEAGEDTKNQRSSSWEQVSRHQEPFGQLVVQKLEPIANRKSIDSSKPITQTNLPEDGSVVMSCLASIDSKQQIATDVSQLPLMAKRQKSQELHASAPSRKKRRTIEREQSGPLDLSSPVKIAPQGIIAHRVRQSLQFQSSLETYDHEREKLLFGKSLLEVQAENYSRIPVKQKTAQTRVNLSQEQRQEDDESSRPAKRRLTNVSSLQPQKSLHYYQNALGLDPEQSVSGSVVAVDDISPKPSTNTHTNQLSTSLALKQSKPSVDMFDKHQVNESRKRMEKIKHVLEIQYERQKNSLEQSLRNQMHASVNSHLRSMKRSNQDGLQEPCNGTLSMVLQHRLESLSKGRLLSGIQTRKSSLGDIEERLKRHEERMRYARARPAPTSSINKSQRLEEIASLGSDSSKRLALFKGNGLQNSIVERGGLLSKELSNGQLKSIFTKYQSSNNLHRSIEVSIRKSKDENQRQPADKNLDSSSLIMTRFDEKLQKASNRLSDEVSSVLHNNENQTLPDQSIA